MSNFLSLVGIICVFIGTILYFIKYLQHYQILWNEENRDEPIIARLLVSHVEAANPFSLGAQPKSIQRLSKMSMGYCAAGVFILVLIDL